MRSYLDARSVSLRMRHCFGPSPLEDLHYYLGPPLWRLVPFISCTICTTGHQSIASAPGTTLIVPGRGGGEALVAKSQHQRTVPCGQASEGVFSCRSPMF